MEVAPVRSTNAPLIPGVTLPSDQRPTPLFDCAGRYLENEETYDQTATGVDPVRVDILGDVVNGIHRRRPPESSPTIRPSTNASHVTQRPTPLFGGPPSPSPHPDRTGGDPAVRPTPLRPKVESLPIYTRDGPRSRTVTAAL